MQYAFCGLGGAGAQPYTDGLSYLGDVIELGGLTLPNIESNEMEFPHLTEFHEFLMDSGGAGKFRGGLGVRYRIHFLGANSSSLVMFGDGKETPPYGLFGGKPGSLNLPLINEGLPTEHELPAKGNYQLQSGDSYTIYASGGGGWGDPLEREPGKVKDDVLNEFVSEESARRDYGVVLDESLAVDLEATKALRTEMTKGRDER